MSSIVSALFLPSFMGIEMNLGIPADTLNKHPVVVNIPVSVQTAGTATVPGTSTSCAPPSSAVSWFCPVPAADSVDTPPAAPPAKPKDRPGARCHLLLCSTRRNASAPVDVPESLRMCKFTTAHLCLQQHEEHELLMHHNENRHLQLLKVVKYI